MIAYELDLNVRPGGVLPRLDVSQYDNGQTITCALWDGSTPFTMPNGSAASVTGTKPDGTGFTYNCTYQNNQPVVTITEQMTAVSGDVMCELVIIKDGERQGTINFVLAVEPAALRSDVPISETDIPIIQQIPEYVDEVAGYAEEAEAWATGGEEGTPSATNNAKYWAEKSQEYAIGAFHWKNKVAFANLPTSDLTVGDVYEVADAFTTDSRFSEGAGVQCEAGTEVVWTDGGKWSILTPPGVTSFNGRKGAVSPASGDYSASQISSSAITGQTNVEGALTAINSSLTNLIKVQNFTNLTPDSSGVITIPAITHANYTLIGAHINRNGWCIIPTQGTTQWELKMVDPDTNAPITGNVSGTAYFLAN